MPGREMHELLSRLFPICRSITGDGVRETLSILGELAPLDVHEVPTGTKAFDWTVPPEWNIRDAFIADEQGNKVVDFKRNNLHVIGYSTPVDRWLPLSELQDHLHSREDYPDAIPYVTSYYEKRWGFCIAHNKRVGLKDGNYRVFIDSELRPGHLTYAECIIPGELQQEVFLSTYVCHPSMANDELSGPVVATFISRWLATSPRRYTYRIIFIPETIGAITYLSRHREEMRKNTIAGFNLSCIGDERTYSYVASRYENTLADKIALHALSFKRPGFARYSFLKRGSDERQYGSPGVDLPLVTLCRSKYGTYPEYHTSLDNLDLVTPAGLQGGYELVKDCIQLIEHNRKYRVTCYGEPNLSRRGLYPTLGTSSSTRSVRSVLDLIAYADGSNDLVDIGNITGIPAWELHPMAEKLVEAGVLVTADDQPAARPAGPG